MLINTRTAEKYSSSSSSSSTERNENPNHIVARRLYAIAESHELRYRKKMKPTQIKRLSHYNADQGQKRELSELVAPTLK